MIEAASIALRACAGKTLPNGIPVDPCQGCLRRGAEVVTLLGVMQPAAEFVDDGPKVGWRCPNQRSGVPTLM